MQTLEMRFGNPKLIADSVLKELKRLPNLMDDSGKLVEFATKLKNTVLALKSVKKGGGYLHNPELVYRILYKLPSSIINNCIRYRPVYSESSSDLEKISDFMFHEAKLNIDAGIIPFNRSSKRKNSRSDNPRERSDRMVLVTHIANEVEPPEKRARLIGECVYCKRRNHVLTECRKFARERVNQRWKIAKNMKLCYRCLELISEKHSRSQCGSPMCVTCGRNHHQLLHFVNVQNDSSNLPFSNSWDATDRSQSGSSQRNSHPS